MADDVLEDAGPAPDTGKAKREPPTIDLEATKVAETGSAPKANDTADDRAGEAKSEAKSAETNPAAEPRQPAEPKPEPTGSQARSQASRARSPWVVAPLSGAVAAALVLAVGWLLGWPAVQTPPAPQVSAAAVDALTARVAGLESRAARTPAPVTDPAVTARIDATEKSVATLRGDLASLRAQSDKLAASVSAAKAAPGDSKAAPGDSAAAPAPSVDLSAINERIDAIERATRTQAAAIAQANEKVAAAKPQDDAPLRRVVAAALLDVSVRHGDPFAGELAAAKALSSDPGKLKPLDEFAAKGVPNPPALNRELLALIPKLSPATETATTGSGVIDRLKAGASNLVRVERTDRTGNDRSAVVARVTAAALRNDFAESRRELSALDAADRAPAQAWLDKAAARDAALAASRQFAEEAMASLAKAAQ
jgi:hypothetical protein